MEKKSLPEMQQNQPWDSAKFLCNFAMLMRLQGVALCTHVQYPTLAAKATMLHGIPGIQKRLLSTVTRLFASFDYFSYGKIGISCHAANALSTLK